MVAQLEDTWALSILAHVLVVQVPAEDMCLVLHDRSQILAADERIHYLDAGLVPPPSDPALQYIRCQTYDRPA
jgi:hypothetical protein